MKTFTPRCPICGGPANTVMEIWDKEHITHHVECANCRIRTYPEKDSAIALDDWGKIPKQWEMARLVEDKERAAKILDSIFDQLKIWSNDNAGNE